MTVVRCSCSRRVGECSWSGELHVKSVEFVRRYPRTFPMRFKYPGDDVDVDLSADPEHVSFRCSRHGPFLVAIEDLTAAARQGVRDLRAPAS